MAELLFYTRVEQGVLKQTTNPFNKYLSLTDTKQPISEDNLKSERHFENIEIVGALYGGARETRAPHKGRCQNLYDHLDGERVLVICAVQLLDDDRKGGRGSHEGLVFEPSRHYI